jgi:hypothetical protein
MAGQLANIFVSGHANPVQFQVLGQGQVATLNITGSTLDEEINRIMVTHSGTGGLAARLANVLDVKGNVTADFDLLNPPYLNPPAILPGVSGIILIYVSPTRPFQVPCMIAKVHWESKVDGKVSWNFDYELNALAGVYVRPTF